MFVGDALDGSKGGLNVERTGSPDRASAGVNPGFLTGGDIGFDEVSGSKSELFGDILDGDSLRDEFDFDGFEDSEPIGPLPFRKGRLLGSL